MAQIRSDEILSCFSLIRDAILANATLAVKFSKGNIYQFEPKHKSHSFIGFPYIWADVPGADPEKTVFDNSVVEHSFSAPILLRMDWEARDNAVSYANAILKAIADYESTFQRSGYYDVMIRLVDVNPDQVIEQKQIVETEFEISFHGSVRRG